VGANDSSEPNGIDSIPAPVVFGNHRRREDRQPSHLWFKEHRPKWLRNEDAESEHMLRDLRGFGRRRGRSLRLDARVPRPACQFCSGDRRKRGGVA